MRKTATNLDTAVARPRIIIENILWIKALSDGAAGAARGRTGAGQGGK
jgi:hypothetical protein